MTSAKPSSAAEVEPVGREEAVDAQQAGDDAQHRDHHDVGQDEQKDAFQVGFSVGKRCRAADEVRRCRVGASRLRRDTPARRRMPIVSCGSAGPAADGKRRSHHRRKSSRSAPTSRARPAPAAARRAWRRGARRSSAAAMAASSGARSTGWRPARSSTCAVAALRGVASFSSSAWPNTSSRASRHSARRVTKSRCQSRATQRLPQRGRRIEHARRSRRRASAHRAAARAWRRCRRARSRAACSSLRRRLACGKCSHTRPLKRSCRLSRVGHAGGAEDEGLVGFAGRRAVAAARSAAARAARSMATASLASASADAGACAVLRQPRVPRRGA